MKACSAVAVKNALCHLTSLSEQANVKRKFRQLNGSKIRWWHIVSGDEETLKRRVGSSPAADIMEAGAMLHISR